MTKEQAQVAFKAVVEEMRPIVEKVESSLPTTKNHYGDYMAILSQAPDHGTRRLMALALIKAGANESGVTWALTLLS